MLTTNNSHYETQVKQHNLLQQAVFFISNMQTFVNVSNADEVKVSSLVLFSTGCEG